MALTREVYEFLTRPIRTLKAIRELDSRIRAVEAGMYPSGMRYDRDRVQGTKTDPMLLFAERIDELMNKLDELRTDYLFQLRAVEDAIEKLDDENERAVLTYRYINRKPYTEIADIMFYSERTIHRLHRKGTQNIIVPKTCQ